MKNKLKNYQTIVQRRSTKKNNFYKTQLKLPFNANYGKNDSNVKLSKKHPKLGQRTENTKKLPILFDQIHKDRHRIETLDHVSHSQVAQVASDVETRSSTGAKVNEDDDSICEHD